MNNDKDITKVRLHDGIVGILNIGSILLASKFGFDWIYVAAAVALSLPSSNHNIDLILGSMVRDLCQGPLYTIRGPCLCH